VRGHDEHPKNEYVDSLAVAAAREQKSSDGAVESKFLEWLSTKQAKKKFLGYNPDAEYESLERRLAAGEEFPLAVNGVTARDG
jgi:hypothetical protein